MSDLESKTSKTGEPGFPAQVVEEVSRHDDVAGAFLAKVAKEAPELLADWAPAEEKRLIRWKIDPIVMTLSQFCLMMGAVDKVCIGTAAVLGMRTDLGLVGQQYSWISSMIYFGAIVAVFPSLYIMQRLPTGKWIAFNCSVWGIILMCSAAATNFVGLLIARFILGLFESVIFAGFGIIVAAWWTKREQPWRTAVIFSTLSSVINGLLSYASAFCTGSLGQWQVLFLSVGAITLAWAVLCWFCLSAGPTDAWWLNTREKVIAIRRVRGNQAGIENRVFKKDQFIEAFLDPKSWLIFFINIVLNIPNNGVLTFNSIIVATLGFTTKQTLLLAIPTGVISWISSIVFGYLAVKTGKRCLIAMLACLVPFSGTIILYLVPRSNTGGSLAGLYILFAYWGPYIVVQTLMYANTGGYTKKTATYAIAYIGYSVGNLIGPQVFKAEQAPKYTSGVVAMLTCYAVAILLIAVYWVYALYLNKQKAKELAAHVAKHGEADLLDGLHDQTDKHNPRFVYTF